MWFWLSLASAFLGAIDLILSKHALRNVSPVVLFWALNAFTIPILLTAVLITGIPATNTLFWLAVVSSCVTWTVGKNMFNNALKNHLVSKIIPLTSFSVIFTYIFGLLFLHESIRLIPMTGLISVIIGSYILNVDEAREDIFKPFKLIFANKASVVFMVALAIISITAIFDKLSLQNTIPTSIIFVIFLENTLETLMVTPLPHVQGKTYLGKAAEGKY